MISDKFAEKADREYDRTVDRALDKMSEGKELNKMEKLVTENINKGDNNG